MNNNKLRSESFKWEHVFPALSVSERSFIGLLLTNSSLLQKVKDIKPEHITDLSLRFIYKVLWEFNKNSQDWTWQTVSDTISNIADRPDELEYPLSYISELAVAKADESNLEFYVQQIRSITVRKNIVNSIPGLEGLIKDPTKNIVAIADSIKQIQNQIKEQGFSLSHKEVKQGNFREIFNAEADKIRNTPFIGTGYKCLDNSLTWGFQAGHLSIIAGRPSMGKSTLRENIQLNLAKQNIANICISREQSVFAEMVRLIAIHNQISLKRLSRVRDWDDVFNDQIQEMLKEFQDKFPIRIVEPVGSYFLNDIVYAVNDARAEGFDPKVIFIDLFAQLDDVNVADGQAATIQKKVMEAADIAKALGIHVCLVVQLKRLGNAKQREDIDMRESLKGSGGYEERADLIFMVERPGYYDKEAEDNIMRITILKQRDGATPSKELSFKKEFITISDDLESTYEPDKNFKNTLAAPEQGKAEGDFNEEFKL